MANKRLDVTNLYIEGSKGIRGMYTKGGYETVKTRRKEKKKVEGEKW